MPVRKAGKSNDLTAIAFAIRKSRVAYLAQAIVDKH
jgi:hypothetical protein